MLHIYTTLEQCGDKTVRVEISPEGEIAYSDFRIIVVTIRTEFERSTWKYPEVEEYTHFQ